MNEHELRRKLDLANRALEIVTRELAEIEAAISTTTAADVSPSRGPGRPPIEPTGAQIAQVLRLRFTNGRLGVRAIGARVDPPLSWEIVKRILTEYASGNTPPASGKPSARAARPSRSGTSTRAGKEG